MAFDLSLLLGLLSLLTLGSDFLLALAFQLYPSPCCAAIDPPYPPIPSLPPFLPSSFFNLETERGFVAFCLFGIQRISHSTSYILVLPCIEAISPFHRCVNQPCSFSSFQFFRLFLLSLQYCTIAPSFHHLMAYLLYSIPPLFWI